MAQTLEEVEVLHKPIDAQTFFDKYVSKRKPVKFSFVLDEFKAMSQQWKDNHYLKSKAGKEQIFAEVRQSMDDKFGIAKKEQMEFGNFLDLLSTKQGCNYYLTVQEIECNEYGPNKLYASPLNEALLQDDIPMKPSILSYLELHQINCWMGHSETGSSSKLHHDYHDNLYVVIRGQKQFALFPPKCVHSLYVHGEDEICNVFQNGLITYDADYREDGANQLNVRQWYDGSGGAEEHKDCTDDDEEEQNEFDEDAFNGDDSDDLDEEQKFMDKVLDEKLKQMEGNESNDDDDCDDGDEDDDCEDVLQLIRSDQQPPSKRQKVETKTTRTEPVSFSRVDLNEDDDILQQTFPKYAEIAKLKQELTIGEGEMLYLPCGWFHEVVSKSNAQLCSHLAVNYWLHPFVTNGTMQRPYCDSFWQDFNRKQHKQENGKPKKEKKT